MYLYLNENTTVKELKDLIKDMPDDSKIYTDINDGAIRFENYIVDDKKSELYIELV